MAYISKNGRKPMEFASKTSHSFIINDESIIDFIKNCNLPQESSDINIDLVEKINIDFDKENTIKGIVAVDGGYTEIAIKSDFPSSQMAFFQIGASFFEMSDLENLKRLNFIDEEDMQKLRDIERLKFSVPIKGICLKSESSLNKSIRKCIFDLFMSKPDEKNLFIDTLYWMIFKEYDTNNRTKNIEYTIAECPNLFCNCKNIVMKKSIKNSNYILKCPDCGDDIFLTDIFRFQEVIDEELGASGILGYITTLIEQIFLFHIMRIMLKIQPLLLNETLFIKDGPLGFFGQTARMHKYARELINYLNEKYNIHLVGLEKTGSFVEHACQIKDKINKGEALLLNNEYIYTYILPGKPDPEHPYAWTSYYSSKIIFKDRNNSMYVITLPTKNEFIVNDPKKDNFKNIDIILKNIELLRCDMYDDAIIPIALVNKLVSLANHPSSTIIEKFAKRNINK